TCVDCHPAHRILPPSNPASTVYAANVPETCGRCHADPDHMAGRDVATDQVDKYYGSVHGKLLTEDEDLSAPVCNDCHGNHGAAPPGLTSVRNVCGQCHSVMGDYFDQSGHVEIFRENGLPGCATCHDHHAIQPVDEASLGDRSVEVCMRCHEEGDSAGSAFDTMAGVLDSLEWEVSEAEGILLDAEDRGMEVSQALFELEDVTNAQTHARSAIHTFKVDPVRTEAQAGFVITDRARDRGVAALAEYDFRRMGLGLAAGIILLLVMTLLFKIREADARIAELLAMIGGFFDTTMGASGGMPPTHEAMRLAACGILLEATYVDDSFSDEERGHLIELIRTRYGLVRSEADELIALVQAQRSGPVELGRLADLVSRHYSESERRALVKELWGLVYSDGVLTEREVSFMSQVAKLLHVGTEEVAATRREVEAG
ncbi:MAG: TerB family tellurite resistance protein, partial [Gemmatimonadota bacterium]|nr:TerB family tellurite resistance protein [Gemmatimonadota bacterium]